MFDFRALALLAVFLALPVGGQGGEQGVEVERPNDLSTLQLGKTLAGDPVSLGDLQGQVVVVEFWGST